MAAPRSRRRRRATADHVRAGRGARPAGADPHQPARLRGLLPVRIGNGAVDQFQADVIGEVLVALDAARVAGLGEDRFSWSLQQALVEQAIERIDMPDQGMWEVRDEPEMFTHSRVMVWAALDCAVRAVRTHGLPGDVSRWESFRDHMRREIEANGYDAERGHFVQHYGTTAVDGALLLLPQVGFCAADDPRMVATVAEIERRLLVDGFVMRYSTDDGVAGGENAFLACTFWLVEQYAMVGRLDDATALMERACATANDLGLLSEEYDPAAARQTGNFPRRSPTWHWCGPPTPSEATAAGRPTEGEPPVLPSSRYPDPAGSGRKFQPDRPEPATGRFCEDTPPIRPRR
nr:glycoside hydrolase family 15 protein [Tessaracoccus coleopterorum]